MRGSECSHFARWGLHRFLPASPFRLLGAVHPAALRYQSLTVRRGCGSLEIGGPCADRTHDQQIKSLLLYRLS